MTKGRVLVDEFNSLTISATARYLGVSRPTVYALIESGQLRSHHIPGSVANLTGEPAPRILRADADRVKRKRERNRG